MHDIFVGRENEQKRYRDLINGDDAWMLTITGLGGIGKTRLLKHFLYLTPPDTRVVTLNFADDMNLRTDPLKLLEMLALCLRFSTDEQQYALFIQHLRRDYEQVEQYQRQMQQALTNSALKQSKEAHTIVATVPDDASIFTQKLQQAMQEVEYQSRETATEEFYALIDTLQTDVKRLVLMFDTCELLNEPESWETNQWLMNNFLPRLHTYMQHREQRCFVVLAGRIPLSSEVIDEQDQQHIVLSMLSEQEADSYLAQAGIRNAVTRQHIYEITHGHALCIAIIRAFYQESDQTSLDDIDATTLEKDFDEHLSLAFINERILNNLMPPLKELTRFGVLLRSFDLPTLRAVFPDLLPDEQARYYFEQFIRYPYIEEQGNYRYTFHELVREVLAHITQKDHHQQWIHYHENALAYFSKKKGTPQQTGPDVEWYYHALALALASGKEVRGMAEWQQAVQEARSSKTRQDVVALLQVAYDHALELTPASCAIREFEQARSYTYIQQWDAAHKHYEQARTYFEQAQDQHGQANVLKALGDLQRDQDKRDTALLYYQRAQELYAAIEDNLGQARVLQAVGNIKHLRNDLDEALVSYQQAFDLFGGMKDPSAPVEACLGQAEACKAIADIQRQQNQRRTALRYYSRAISLYEDAGSDIGKAEATRARDELSAVLEREQKRGKNSFAYICYARADRTFAARLKDDLQARSINVFYNEENILPSSFDWEKLLRQEIRDASAILFIASPQAKSSSYLKNELKIAALHQRSVYPLWIDGESWYDASPLGLEGVQYIDARKGKYQQALEQVISIFNQVVPSISTKPPDAKQLTSALSVRARNPYKGLRAFGLEDARDFFGREKLVKELLSKLQRSLMTRSESIRLLSVIGPSGSGKSSVVMAGLLPQLHRGALPDSEEWIYLDPIVPGAHPLEALTAALAHQLPDHSINSIREDLDIDSGQSLHLFTTALVKQKQSQQVVLFVDQFEELFTQARSPDERQQFIDLLTIGATKIDGPLIVILTLRADFYDRLMDYPRLYKLMATQFTGVFPMNGEELRAAIEQPAALPNVQVTFEEGLVDDLLFEVRGQAGALPLLQFTLDLLFQQREGNLLTLQAYHTIGGMKGALSRHAEKTYQDLPTDEHRVMARALFLRLIEVSSTEQDTTRRRVLLDDFKFSNPTQTEQFYFVIEAFIAARLLTASRAGNTTANVFSGTMNTFALNTTITTIEISHEAIVREWARLKEWLRNAREDILFQQTISTNVEAWKQRGKPKDSLYRGSQLKEAKAWASRNIPNKQEDEFIHTSSTYNIQRKFYTSILLLVVDLLLVLLTLFASPSSLEITFNSILRLLSNPTPVVSTLTVTTLNPDGPGSLRQTITHASTGNTIIFATSLHGIIAPTSSEIVLDKNLTIRGLGAGNLVISGRQGGHIRIARGANVTISGLIFQDSRADSSIIVNAGSLTLTNTTIADNKAAGTSYGGGLTNQGTLTLTSSLITRNQSINGGGIYNDSGSRLTIENTIISNNRASQDGGGIFNNGGNVNLTNSTVSYNEADNKGGGASNTNGDIAFTNSTASFNGASKNPNTNFSFNQNGTTIFNGSMINGSY